MYPPATCMDNACKQDMALYKYTESVLVRARVCECMYVCIYTAYIYVYIHVKYI